MTKDKSLDAVANAGIRLDALTRRGASRRDVLRALAAGGLMSMTGAGLLAASGAAIAQQAKPKQGGKIRVATQSASAADTLDPAKGALGTDYVRANMFYNGLTELDSHLGAQMALAESLETKDATVWVVKLRSGVQFHDGKSLAPADVVYSIMRHKDPATASKAKTLADQIKEVKATGPNEVTITLEGANADLPVILATSHFLIIKDGTKDFKTAVGTGPFKVKEFSPGVRTVGVKNEKYWKPGMPHLDEIELIGIGDESARVNALLSGDVQLINAVSPRSTERIKGTSGFTVLETKTGPYTDLIVRDEGGITGNRGFPARHDVPDGSRADPPRGVPRLRRDRQRPADRSDQQVLHGGPAATRLRSRQGQVPLPEGEARQRAGADRGVAGGGRVQSKWRCCSSRSRRKPASTCR